MDERPTITAYFIAGPDHGAIRELPRDALDWRVIGQREVQAITSLVDHGVDGHLSSFRYHEYRRTKELSYPYMRGCWIFEWMGERGG